MGKKESGKKRTEVKDLAKKGKKLSKGDMKKIKGGFFDTYEQGDIKAPKLPRSIK